MERKKFEDGFRQMERQAEEVASRAPTRTPVEFLEALIADVQTDAMRAHAIAVVTSAIEDGHVQADDMRLLRACLPLYGFMDGDVRERLRRAYVRALADR